MPAVRMRPLVHRHRFQNVARGMRFRLHVIFIRLFDVDTFPEPSTDAWRPHNNINVIRRLSDPIEILRSADREMRER